MNLHCTDHSHCEMAKWSWCSLNDTGLSNVEAARQVLHWEVQVKLNYTQEEANCLLTGCIVVVTVTGKQGAFSQ